MKGGLAAVAWKEWRSLVGGRTRRQVLLTGGMLTIWALWFPIQMGGRDFVSDPVLMVILSITMPLVVTGIVVPDAIAGERERHTLATLLASRLGDRDILFGKLGFGVVLGWMGTPLMMVVGLVVANLVALDAAPLFYDPLVLVATLALALLVAVLAGAIAIVVSLRVSSTQEAQQITVLSLMIPFMLVGFGAMAVLSDRARAREVLDFLASADVWPAVAVAIAVMLVVDGLLVAAADRQFRRGRLIARG